MIYLIIFLCISLIGKAYGEYHSQVGQDQFLNENYFKNKRNGVFVDIGAHDGVSFSNTFFFEKELGWSGICIEPLPDIFQRLKQNRSCICLNCCISSRNGTVSFARPHCPQLNNSEMYSGIIDEKLLKSINELLKKSGGGWVETITVPSFRLNKILKKYNIYEIDYLSIDTEGAELEILKSIDFNKFKIRFMTVENNNKDKAIPEFLASKGFVLIAELVQDDVYKNVSLN
jgi:FkbM family methyltransferase